MRNFAGHFKIPMTCICSGANQVGKMPLRRSLSCSREQRSKERQKTNLGKWIKN